MENFMTWDILLTYGGCVAGTVILTEWLKKVLPKIPVQFVSFIIASSILVVGHIATGTFAWAEVFLYLINAVAVSLASNGGYDILARAFGKTDKTDGELLFDSLDDENNLYVNLSKEPSEFTNGETVTFKVLKTPQK